MPAIFNSVFDLALVVFGFGLLIFLHELGHFLAARWAGIRVLAFAIGFGPALVSYRKGFGFRSGSTEGEYLALIAQAKGKDQSEREAARRKLAGETGVNKPVSTTEYRLNALPFGGYVKMLGQEDANPAAVSTAPDSYQSCPPIKRMVVISAGVIANIITALLLFVVVFMVGLRTEPAVIGLVDPTSPAATARLVSTDLQEELGEGLKPGDAVLSVDGEAPRHFNDLGTRVAMSDPNRPMRITVARVGVAEPIEFELEPRSGQTSGLREIGVAPPFTSRIDPQFADSPTWRESFDRLGLRNVEPGMMLEAVNGIPVSNRAEVLAIARASGGQPLNATFTDEDGQSVTAAIKPLAEYELDDANPDPGTLTPIDHLLGLMPVLSVSATAKRGASLGLVQGDVFLRLGEVEFPSVLTGVREIKRHAGRPIRATVLRTYASDEKDAPRVEPHEVELELSVTRKGTIGFSYVAANTNSNLFALPPSSLWTMPGGEPFTPAAGSLIDRPGVRIVAVDGAPTDSLEQVRAQLLTTTASAFAQGSESATVEVTLLSAFAEGEPQRVTKQWTLSQSDLERLHSLGYSLGAAGSLFEPERFTLKAEGPADAIVLGLGETRRIAQQTYLTFLRLFQGSVKVEHLRGPVGIAHIGTIIADRGIVWLLFYMALISINLAVVNFLPLPIVDGGQFLMLIYEQLRGKPVPIALQGALTLGGLALVGVVFLVVTFNDISNLLGR